jgi:hypothetical protein
VDADEWRRAGLAVGAGQVARLSPVPRTPGPPCRSCGRPVEWRHVRWTIVRETWGDGQARVTAGTAGFQYHPACERAAARERLADEVDNARRVGRSVVDLLAPVVASIGAGLGSAVGAAVPVVRQSFDAVRSAGVAYGRVVAGQQRRRLRAVPVERPIRAVGQAAGWVGVAVVEPAAQWVAGRVGAVERWRFDRRGDTVPTDGWYGVYTSGEPAGDEYVGGAAEFRRLYLGEQRPTTGRADDEGTDRDR